MRIGGEVLRLRFDLRELIHRRRAREAILLAHALGADMQRLARPLDEIREGVTLSGDEVFAHYRRRRIAVGLAAVRPLDPEVHDWHHVSFDREIQAPSACMTCCTWLAYSAM